MTMDELKEQIADTLACDVSEVKPESNLIDDLQADSLSIVELQMNLEEATGIKISEDELPNLKTVQDVYDALKKAE
jgi:acyl carrier protein